MKRVYVNIDVNSPNDPYIRKILDQKTPFCEESIYTFVDAYKRTDATDIMFNTFCQFSLPPTKYFDDISMLVEFSDNVKKSDYFTDTVRWFYSLYAKHNIDPFQVWINRCRENGLNPWLSIRMNDSHHLDRLVDPSLDTFTRKALKNGWLLGDDYDYFKYCMDYSVDEIRERMLGYIEEQLLRYDVYGLELDFMREIMVFKHLTADMKVCTEILTNFIRQVKKITQKVAKVHGHDIKICVRTIRDITQANYFGHDLETWAKEGLIDIVNPTPRWTGGDSGIPVQEWKKLLPNVEIAAGLEIAVNYEKSRGLSFASPEVARGLCASFLSQGADGIYFYNYFLNPEEDEKYVDEDIRIAHSFHKNLSILMACNDLEKIHRNYALRFPIISQFKEGFVKAPPMWEPIPSKLSENEEKCFEIITGKIPNDKKVYLVIGADKNIENSPVTLNGNVCNKWSDVDLRFLPGIGSQPFANISAYTANYVADETICKRCFIETDNLTDYCQTIKINAQSELKIEWIEIYTF